MLYCIGQKFGGENIKKSTLAKIKFAKNVKILIIVYVVELDVWQIKFYDFKFNFSPTKFLSYTVHESTNIQYVCNVLICDSTHNSKTCTLFSTLWTPYKVYISMSRAEVCRLCNIESIDLMSNNTEHVVCGLTCAWTHDTCQHKIKIMCFEMIIH